MGFWPGTDYWAGYIEAMAAGMVVVSAFSFFAGSSSIIKSGGAENKNATDSTDFTDIASHRRTQCSIKNLLEKSVKSVESVAFLFFQE
jgi:hypothetical protein